MCNSKYEETEQG